MDIENELSVSSVDRIAGSVIVTFNDGQSALYSAFLLRSVFDRAEPLLQGEDQESPCDSS